jgi:hypothetical protein
MNRKNIKIKMDQMGFDYGSTIEAVLTTWNHDGTVNAAPMGVIRNLKDQIIIKPYRASNTFRNMLRNKEVCVNTTQDSEIFLKTAFKDEGLGLFPIKKGYLLLEGSDASIKCKIINVESENTNRPEFTAEIKQILTKKRIPISFNRGRNNAIEAIIQASHIRYKSNERGEDVKTDLINFNYNIQIIKKISASNSTEMKVANKLESLIKKWRLVK